MADVKKIIKDLQGDFSGSNDDQFSGIQLLKGLAGSDEELANKFMKKLDKATTSISKELTKGESTMKTIEVTKEAQITEDLALEPGDKIQVLKEQDYS